jgi:phosphopantothenoylcysteine decarboxylase/phosphopantothenate--cysteine ligase
VKFVVTAGPTREAIDPVRYISNRSSGKMGYAIAEAALARGDEVTLISGPACIAPPSGADFISITTSDELYDAVHRALRGCDVLVMCAAVADYKPAAVASQKMKKRNAPFALRLIATRDILASLPSEKRRYLGVGFAAETNHLEINARQKLLKKNCDLMVANDVSAPDSGMESDENEVVVFFSTGETKKISRTSKRNIARELVKIISKMMEKSLTKKS